MTHIRKRKRSFWRRGKIWSYRPRELKLWWRQPPGNVWQKTRPLNNPFITHAASDGDDDVVEKYIKALESKNVMALLMVGFNILAIDRKLAPIEHISKMKAICTQIRWSWVSGSGLSSLHADMDLFWGHVLLFTKFSVRDSNLKMSEVGD